MDPNENHTCISRKRLVLPISACTALMPLHSAGACMKNIVATLPAGGQFFLRRTF
jgi:hypothetical protein